MDKGVTDDPFLIDDTENLIVMMSFLSHSNIINRTTCDSEADSAVPSLVDEL